MIKKLLKCLIGLYKLFLSPVLPPACRFYPSCSDYASRAIDTHGAARGMVLAAKRLMRCHPLMPGGYDPPPPPGYSAVGSRDIPTDTPKAKNGHRPNGHGPNGHGPKGLDCRHGL
jgi:putative membrane protein insertion efficiency factor